MPDGFDWLPDFVDLDGFANDWPGCRDRLYGEFHRDFVASHPEFLGKRVGVSRQRIVDGREAAFHHCVTEEDDRGNRVNDYRRCQRLGWPRRLIESVGTDRVRWWKERQGSKRRAYVALPDFSYLVVLEEMTSHCVLVTAFPVDKDHTRRNHSKRYDEATEKG